jgi:hypothetical protein
MKTFNILSLALLMATMGTFALAAADEKHDAHHPAGTASAASAKGAPDTTKPDMARMDMQMQGMAEMHDKMMAAKTPEERKALMDQHMKTMQEGIGMMKGMAAAGMKGDMASRQKMMEKRMDMMQSMMQMMMDRLPMAPAK